MNNYQIHIYLKLFYYLYASKVMTLCNFHILMCHGG
jgi:hypothetical protein